LGLFDDPAVFEEAVTRDDLPPMAELPINELLAMEKAVTGLYLSGHPLKAYEPCLAQLQVTPIGEWLTRAEENADRVDGKTVRLFGTMTSLQTKNTKSGATMAYAVLEDLSADIELIFFPKTLAAVRGQLQENAVVTVSGRISIKEEQPPSVIVDRLTVIPSPEALLADKPRSEKYGLYLRLSSDADPAWATVKTMLEGQKGDRPVFVRFEDSGKLVKASNLSVSVSVGDISRLKRLLGDTNVALID
ncbi:MAG: hypothetical protein IKV35_06385, partial [Clostridia bacterium]|nr:hypothetical protein [Clostridia bacterium]